MKKIKLSNSKSRALTGSVIRMNYALSSALLILAGVVLVFLSYSKPEMVDNIRAQFAHRLSPALAQARIPLDRASMFFEDITGFASLQSTNATLREENQKLKAWYSEAQSLRAENEMLRDMLKVKGPQHYGDIDFVTAPIALDASHHFAKSLLIQGGISSGITKNAIALSESGLAGRVIESSENTARVLLLSDMNARVPVMVNHRDGSATHAVLAGQNDATPKLTHYPEDMTFESGDFVMTSGAGSMFPPGIPVGQIAINSDGSPVITPFMQPEHLLYLKILLTDR